MRQKNTTNNTLQRQRPAARSGDNSSQQPSTSIKTNTNTGRSHVNTGTVKNYGTSHGGSSLAIQEHSSAAKNVNPEKKSQQPSTSKKTNTNTGRSQVNTGTVKNYGTSRGGNNLAIQEHSSAAKNVNPEKKSQQPSTSKKTNTNTGRSHVNTGTVKNYGTSHGGNNLAIQEHSSAAKNVYPETERTVEMYYGNYTSDGYSAEALVYCEYSDDEEHSGGGIQIVGVFASYGSDDEYDENSGMIDFFYDSDDD